LDELEAGQEEVEEYLEAIDADLGELEEEIYGHDHDHDDDDDEDDDDEDDDEETNFVEMECPKCKETVYFEEDFLYDDDVEVACPECGATIYKTGSSGEDKADAGAGSSS
ncbi:MAG: AraC family transcriptional regulator, partial [Bacillota bacterium]